MNLKNVGILMLAAMLVMASSVVGWASAIRVDPGMTTAQINAARESISQMQILKAELSESQKKLSTDLLQLVDSKFLPEGTTRAAHAAEMEHWGQFSPAVPLPAPEGKMSEGRVYTYVYLKSDAVTDRIDPYTWEVTDRDEKNHLAVAWIEVKHLEALASLEGVRAIRTVMPPVVYTGSVTTEGDAIHRTFDVRAAYGQSGSGIKVGIISDGVNSRGTAQASFDLPADGSGLTVLSNVIGGDEGTAMLEIVHDMVPDAELYFHDHGMNTDAFNAAIDALVTAGCNVICDDIGWIMQPFFEDGTVASHVASVLAGHDIIYVSSAGNAGGRHDQDDFFPLAAYPSYHDFSEGQETLTDLYVNIPAGSSVRVVLQWDDQFSSSGNDYNLYLYSRSTSLIEDLSTVVQDGDDDPLEFIYYTATSATAGIFEIWVYKSPSAVAKTLEVFIYPSGSAFAYTNNTTPGDAVFGHAAVPNALAVGAIAANDPGNDEIEYFSSQGPSTIRYPSSESRSKPDVCGVDRVTVTGAGGFPSSFWGTSASAPHVAAIAAQGWGAYPGKTADEVRDALRSGAVDLGAPGWDPVFGYGRADAWYVYQILPVELSSFAARTGDGAVTLHWVTESEIDNLGFYVYRALAEDGEYERLTAELIEGAGNSAIKQEYSFADVRLTNGVTYWYKLEDVAFDGTTQMHGPISVIPQAEEAVEVQTLPMEFGLSQNVPNPFNPVTEIRYQLPEASYVELAIYDVLGQKVRVLVDGFVDASYRSVVWDARDVASGIYFVRMEAGDFVEVRKMALIQ